MRAMRITLLLATLLALCVPLTACKRSLDETDVREFVNKADAATRKRYAPEICELQGEEFTQHVVFQGHEERLGPTDLTLDRKLYCKELGKFARLRQYKLERNSTDIKVASDGKTATVTSELVETMPYYEPDIPAVTPDDFREWQIVESTDESVVGIEGGDLVYLSSDRRSSQSLIEKSSLTLPYD
jgi:hypothetical protein